MIYLFFKDFFFFLSLFISKGGERVSEHVQEGQRERERENPKETPSCQLELKNHEIMTWAKIKS